jgi:hypothetical protein
MGKSDFPHFSSGSDIPLMGIDDSANFGTEKWE